AATEAQTRMHYTFMLERLLDEWAYQAQVRGEINTWIASELGLNPNNLEHRYDIVNERVQQRMQTMFERLRRKLLDSPLQLESGVTRPADFYLEEVRLPWNRTFEVSATAGCSVAQAD